MKGLDRGPGHVFVVASQILSAPEDISRSHGLHGYQGKYAENSLFCHSWNLCPASIFSIHVCTNHALLRPPPFTSPPLSFHPGINGCRILTNIPHLIRECLFGSFLRFSVMFLFLFFFVQFTKGRREFF